VARAANIARPVHCARCKADFTRAHARQKFCISCRPAWQNARAAARAARKAQKPELVPVTPLERDWIAEFNQTCAKRTRKLMEWLKAGNRARDFLGYGEMTGREVSVAIGWVPWPGDWNPPYGAKPGDPMAAHAPDCPCEPCSAARPPEYHVRLAHAA
jgi:hypothetical protein